MNKKFMIAVAGGSGSGKSTVTEHIIQAIGAKDVSVVILDNYYVDLGHLDLAERVKLNFDHPDAFDWELLISDLTKLSQGHPIAMPTYDYSQYTRKADTIVVNPSKIIVFEGIFSLLDPRIRQMMSLKIFVDTADDIRFIRRLQRDISERGRTTDSVIRQYLEQVRPMHRKFIEPTKRYAHIIIPHGANRPALEMIEARISAELNNQTFNSTFFDEE